MAQFLGDIAGLLELFAVVGGLVLLHFAAREASNWLRAAGWLAVLGGLTEAACTGYYWFRYAAQGDFAQAAPMSMERGMMQGDMPMRGDMPMQRDMPMQDDEAEPSK